MNALREECQQLRDELIALRREFHRAPELGLHEYHTAARIERELDRCGIPHERVGETAVVGHLTGNGNGSGLVVLRADIDALPIQETNDVPYRSQTPGMMHACGHDAHTTCLLGAAKVLSAHRADFGGEVRFLFQPAEEIGQGARPLIAAGMLDGAQRVFGLHTASDLPAGTVGVKPGANNAGVDHFIIRIHGKSAHVSTPQLGVDALYIASELVVALQSIVTRMTSPVEPVLIGVGKLNAGTAYNAVAEYAELEGLAEDEVKDQEDFHGDIGLAPAETAKTLKNPKSLKTAGFMPEEDALLEEIISKINERFDGIFSEGDRVIVETLYNRAKENKKLNRQAQKNDEEVYTKSIFPEVFKQVAQDCYIEQMKAFSKLFEDKRFYDTVMATLAQETYRHSNDCAL